MEYRDKRDGKKVHILALMFYVEMPVTAGKLQGIKNFCRMEL